jgi:hypothetical protein
MNECTLSEQVDNEMALEYAAQTGKVETAPETIFLRALDSKRVFGPDLHSPVCVFRLLAGCW